MRERLNPGYWAAARHEARRPFLAGCSAGHKRQRFARLLSSLFPAAWSPGCAPCPPIVSAPQTDHGRSVNGGAYAIELSTAYPQPPSREYQRPNRELLGTNSQAFSSATKKNPPV